MDSAPVQQIELSKKRFSRTWQVLEEGLAEGVAPGFVAGYWSGAHSNQISVCALGQRRCVLSEASAVPALKGEASFCPVRVDTPFDLASVTKVFATATLAAVLVERGWISWTTPVTSFFPGYPHQKVEVRHLLSHTGGYVAWHPFWDRMKAHFAPQPLEAISVQKRQELMRELVLSISPDTAPDVRAVYSDISFLILGFILEEVTQMPLDRAVQCFVWDPLGVKGAFYRRVTRSVVDAVDDLVAATENCSWRGGVIQGQVHDDNCWAMGGYGGHAGAFGTASDLLQFSKGLLEGFLSPLVLKAMWTRVSLPVGCSRTLGWDTPSGDAPAASHLFSPQSIGHLGFTGTSLWIDPVANLSVVLLSNRVHPSRAVNKMKAFRPRFHEAIRRDLLSLSGK